MRSVDQADEPAVHHLAGCFGLIRAAGILGVRLEPCPIPSGLSIAASSDVIALRDEAYELRLNCYDQDCADYKRSSDHRA